MSDYKVVDSRKSRIDVVNFVIDNGPILDEDEENRLYLVEFTFRDKLLFEIELLFRPDAGGAVKRVSLAWRDAHDSFSKWLGEVSPEMDRDVLSLWHRAEQMIGGNDA